jgi:hypothetical protein
MRTADWDRVERRPRGRKDRARWCRGKVGVEHIPEVTKPSGWRAKTCAPRPGWSKLIKFHDPRGDWWCWHRITCATCGKVLVDQDRFPADRCPDREDGRR